MTKSAFAAERLLFTPAAPDTDAIPTIFAFPNEYSVGITSLGYQVVWATLAMRSDVQVSRLFTDTHEQLPRSPELVGFSCSWELDYVNILNLLEFLEIPIHSAARSAADPLVFGGGPVLTANPEPFADFFDIILLGMAKICWETLLKHTNKSAMLTEKRSCANWHKYQECMFPVCTK